MHAFVSYEKYKIEEDVNREKLYTVVYVLKMKEVHRFGSLENHKTEKETKKEKSICQGRVWHVRLDFSSTVKPQYVKT